MLTFGRLFQFDLDARTIHSAGSHRACITPKPCGAPIPGSNGRTNATTDAGTGAEAGSSLVALIRFAATAKPAVQFVSDAPDHHERQEHEGYADPPLDVVHRVGFETGV